MAENLLKSHRSRLIAELKEHNETVLSPDLVAEMHQYDLEEYISSWKPNFANAPENDDEI